jgi:diaminobutyrate-2-oxoglutarate transaminase
METAMAQAIAIKDLQQMPDATITFAHYESKVRTYSRTFPRVFARGEGSYLYDSNGGQWLDFLTAAGSLNYGHNHPVLKQALIDYIRGNGVANSLDLATEAKEEFLLALNEVVLHPRRLEYQCQFCGPTGTDAVEAALKLARKVTGRRGVVAFSNAYHGMSAGSMTISSLLGKYAQEPYSNPGNVTFLPFEGFTDCENEIKFIRQMLTTKGSGTQPPAAFILELIQCEGGVNIPSRKWALQIAELAAELKSVLIIDEIQTGCGRTGKFFSFEHYGIKPQMVCVSKSISAFGSPMSILLIDPALDQWGPGEHTGTFRGFTYSFVTGAKALRHFWGNSDFVCSLSAASAQLQTALQSLKDDFSLQILDVRQIGMLAGIKLRDSEFAVDVQRNCFDRGLIVESVGPDDDTLKLLPPLTISSQELASGIAILRESLEESLRVH